MQKGNTIVGQISKGVATMEIFVMGIKKGT
jgi:hypothetical protein